MGMLHIRVDGEMGVPPDKTAIRLVSVASKSSILTLEPTKPYPLHPQETFPSWPGTHHEKGCGDVTRRDPLGALMKTLCAHTIASKLDTTRSLNVL